jgi:hypothetical protein
MEAARLEGGGDLVEYFRRQARDQPAAFLQLVGRLVPLEVSAEPNGPPLVITQVTHVVIDAKEQLEALRHQIQMLPADYQG